jgi:hypothetical protein
VPQVTIGADDLGRGYQLGGDVVRAGVDPAGYPPGSQASLRVLGRCESGVRRPSRYLLDEKDHLQKLQEDYAKPLME